MAWAYSSRTPSSTNRHFLPPPTQIPLRHGWPCFPTAGANSGHGCALANDDKFRQYRFRIQGSGFEASAVPGRTKPAAKRVRSIDVRGWLYRGLDAFTVLLYTLCSCSCHRNDCDDYYYYYYYYCYYCYHHHYYHLRLATNEELLLDRRLGQLPRGAATGVYDNFGSDYDYHLCYIIIGITCSSGYHHRQQQSSPQNRPS